MAIFGFIKSLERYIREWGNTINMKRLVFLLGLCVCMVYGDEYDKQKAEFISKNFDSKMGLEIKKFELKTETSKLLFKVAMTPIVYKSGLGGTDSNGGWDKIDYDKFWDEYYGLQKRVKEICGTYITETKTEKVTKRDWFGFESTRNESYNYVKQNYTPAQQKCIKSLATLELEMNKDIFKWKLEQMKGDKIEESSPQQRDLTLSYQFADMLWEKFKKEAKLGVIKDFNKPGMEQFVKGVFYWWIVGDGIYRGIDSIDDFFHFYKKKVDKDFSFLYDSIETNNKKLEQKLSDAYYGRKMKIYLSTKEYQEAIREAIRQEQIEQEKKERLSRAKALEEFISNDVRFSQKSLEFNACLGLGDDENQNKEILFSGQYAEIFDKKYYNEEYGGSHSMKEDTSDELKKHTLYRQLAWCAVKKAYESVRPQEYYDVRNDVRKRFSSDAYFKVVLRYVNKKWQAMTEKYPCVDYESAIKSPWYKDEAKIENLLNELDKDFRPIITNHNKEYEQCEKKMFESGREKCKEKLREKTLKQLQAKLK